MRRFTIERLELDMRGVPPATAESAARGLGPALARALAGRELTAAPAARIDAGAVAAGPAADANVLAARVAQQIAAKTSRSRS
jgi:hypothetical protein